MRSATRPAHYPLLSLVPETLRIRCAFFGGSSMFDRRAFLSSIGTAAAAVVALPDSSSLLAPQSTPHPAVTPLPDPALYDKDEEAYWTAIRKQFLIPEDEVYLNNGTVGSSPLPVLRSIIDCYHDAER